MEVVWNPSEERVIHAGSVGGTMFGARCMRQSDSFTEARGYDPTSVAFQRGWEDWPGEVCPWFQGPLSEAWNRGREYRRMFEEHDAWVSVSPLAG